MLRHPVSVWNVLNIHQGQCPNEPGLSEKGFLQACRIATFLETSSVLGIWTSPLPRAKQLALVIKMQGHSNALIFDEPGLMEITNGVIDGMPEEEIRTRFPDGWRKFKERTLDEPCFPGGESLREVARRAKESLIKIAKHASSVPNRRPYDIAVVISHGGLTRLALTEILGFPLEGAFEISQRNGCINYLRWDKEKLIVDHIDSTEHLGDSDFTPKIEL